jgi:hypothetical protein
MTEKKWYLIIHNFFEKMTNFPSKIVSKNNLEDLRQRICAKMELISPDIIERSVQSVGECQMVEGGQFEHLRYILMLTLDVRLFLLEVN